VNAAAPTSVAASKEASRQTDGWPLRPWLAPFISGNALMFCTRAAVIRGFCALALVALAAKTGVKAAAEEPSPFPSAYVVEVSDVTAKVGEPAVMRATLRVRDGYRILKHYNNRVIELSSFDDGVVFERRMVPATLDEDALVFDVPVRATKPGKHPINGVFRVGYIHGTDDLYMVSLRLIANVTGTE
jgi:hypothetical protein